MEAGIDAGRSDRHLPKACKAAHQPGISAGHLPRVEMIVDLDDKACPCCGHALHWIGEDVSERLDIIPAQFRVVLVRRPKYACRACEEAVVQAAAPARLIEGGLSTEALVAQVLVSKYADHLPLYRQAQIYAPRGSNSIARRSPTGSAALPPLHKRLLARSTPRATAGEPRQRAAHCQQDPG